jgi:hypothetical protein
MPVKNRFTTATIELLCTSDILIYTMFRYIEKIYLKKPKGPYILELTK